MKKYVLAGLLAMAAAGQCALAGDRISEDWAAAEAPTPSPVAAPARLPQTSIVEPGLLKDLAPANAARDWKDHMYSRQDAEDYSCALSFAIGGELKSGGYLGTKALGRTLNLSRPGR